MRFRIKLEIDKVAYGNILPINYQYEQSAVIYKLLSSGNEEYATWLHENGFMLGAKKNFKLFCYSPFKIDKRNRKQIGDRLLILADTIEWQISFLPERSTEEFIKGVFSNQTFCIGDTKSRVQMRIRSIEAMPEPEFKETMEYSMMSPLFIKLRKEGERDKYLSPLDDGSEKVLNYSILDKYHSFYGKPYENVEDVCEFELLSRPVKKMRTIKVGTPQESRIIGYNCKLRITAPVKLHRIMYYAGLGSECSQGFGCLEIMQEHKNK